MPKVSQKYYRDTPRSPKWPKFAKRGSKVPKTGPKRSPKLYKIVRKTYEEIGTILERTFSQRSSIF
jgi:hypothetical protein